jgi:uncharacterized protein YgbK (DUF1537 family)
MDAVAEALTREEHGHGPSIIVGSGGIMAALARSISDQAPRTPGPQKPSGPVLAVSASASSTTAEQINDAISNGWEDVPVPAELLQRDDSALVAALDERVSAALRAGRNVVVHTTRGAADPRYGASTPVDAGYVGTLIGGIAARMANAGLTRDIAYVVEIPPATHSSPWAYANSGCPTSSSPQAPSCAPTAPPPSADAGCCSRADR